MELTLVDTTDVVRVVVVRDVTRTDVVELDIWLRVNDVLRGVVVVVTLMSLKTSVEIEGTVIVVVVVVALCSVAVIAGVGAVAVQATGKKLLHARSMVVNGITPKAVQ